MIVLKIFIFVFAWIIGALFLGYFIDSIFYNYSEDDFREIDKDNEDYLN